MSNRIEWTEERLQYLREHYPKGTAQEIADVVGCSDTTVNVKARELGIKKDPSFDKSAFRYRYARRKTKANEG